MLGILLATGEADPWSFTVTGDLLAKCVGAVVVGLILAGLTKLWPYVRAHFGAVRRLRRAERALSTDSPGLWIAPSFPPKPPAIKFDKSIPIVVVANLKGGVGKTTTVANLAGHYARKKNKRVLLIDMDFQGSLSRVALSDDAYNKNLDEQAYGSDSKAAQLVSGRDAKWIVDVAEPVFTVSGAWCIPSYYTLSIMENRVLFEWLISKRKEDIRYLLAKTLHDASLQEKFDLILIDAPPRLTTGCIQALCAATHVLIPTILDGLSAEATGSFVDQLVTNEVLWPNLRLLGAFGNMTNVVTVIGDTEEERALAGFEQEAEVAARDAVKEALNRAGVRLRQCQADPIFPERCFIPDKVELSRKAGERIAYLPSSKDDQVRTLSRAFDRLGDEIDRRIAASRTNATSPS